MNILIIGGTNFIGPAIARELLKAGHTVALFHRSVGNDFDKYTHVRGECGNVEDLQSTLRTTKPDVIIHMVAYFQRHIAVLEKAINGRSIKTIIISSGDVYKGYEVFTRLSEANPVAVPFTEQSPLRDVLYPYRGQLDIDIAHDYEKILVEQAALQSSILNAVILRLGMVYGENDPNRRFAEPIRKMASGAKFIEIAKDMSGLCMCKSYLENIVYGIILAIEYGQVGEIYNLADNWVLTEREWLELLAKKLNWSGNIITLEEESSGLNTKQHFILDTAKIRKSLGYKETVSIDQALSNTIQWELKKLNIPFQ